MACGVQMNKFMKTSNILNLSKPVSYGKLAATIFLIWFVGTFLMDIFPYYGMEKAFFGRYWDFKWTLIGHITAGILATVIGPFQLWKAFRNKYLKLHRWLGKIYLLAILLGVISSTALAWTSAIKINFSWALSLQGLAFAWLVTSGMAYISVMSGRINQHKEWMIRSYVVTLAFVTFRWIQGSPFVIELMPEFTERGPTVVWLCWSIPLLITEVFLSWKKK
jgi:uncharacterized membrane protein